MITMQYTFVLPHDYDMSVIERRIREHGHKLDGFPQLRFKAYLFARKQDGDFSSQDNLYAPFYLWDTPQGIANFLTFPGFTKLSHDFGWPTIHTWIPWHTELGTNLKETRFASRDIVTISPHTNLAELQDKAIHQSKEAVQDGAKACILAFDPTNWTMVKFQLFTEAPMHTDLTTQLYAVGHVSLPQT